MVLNIWPIRNLPLSFSGLPAHSWRGHTFWLCPLNMNNYALLLSEVIVVFNNYLSSLPALRNKIFKTNKEKKWKNEWYAFSMYIINDKIKIRYTVCVTTITKHSQSMKYPKLILLMISVVTNVKSVPLKLPAFDRYIW